MAQSTGILIQSNELPSPGFDFFERQGYVVPFTTCAKDWFVNFLEAESVLIKKQLFLFYLVAELRFSWKKNPKHKISISVSFSTRVSHEEKRSPYLLTKSLD